MGKNGQPKHRQAARELLRRKAQRQPAERLLIVCEGSKTEPLYLGEIRQQLRLPAANVQVQPVSTSNNVDAREARSDQAERWSV